MSWCIKGKTWLLSGSVFQLRSWESTQTLWEADVVPCAAVVRAAPWFHLNPLMMFISLFPVGKSFGGRGFLAFKASARLEAAPAERGGTLFVSRKYPSTSPWWNLSFKKSLDAFSFWGKKGAFYCIKQRLMYFDKPLFELPSLADRFSDILGLDVRSYVCDRGFWEASPLALGKKQNTSVWVMWKAQRIRTSFCLGFTSALYWRQTFTKKGGKKKFWEKLIFFDKSII